MANAGSSEIGFAAPSSARKLTNVWWTYGQYVMVTVDDANFYAQPIAGAAGWYTLSWSSSDQAGSDKTLVTLRTIEPSTNSVLV
jgi:inosine/xanthosine triphosphate pyrophosphatase family protein